MMGIFTSCSSDDKAFDIINRDIQRGALLRNINRIDNNFISGDLNSTFAVEIEEQDGEWGDLLDYVRVYTKYIDRDVSNGNDSSPEIMLKDIEASSFTAGPYGLPRDTLEISYDEVVNKHNLDIGNIRPGDQFEVRLDLVLKDGRSFSNNSASAHMLTDICNYKSPFRYVINVLEPIPDTDFTGTYFYEIVSGNNPEEINKEGFITIFNTGKPNVRFMEISLEGIEFTIAGKSIYPKIYQMHKGFCNDALSIVLTGPSETSFGQFDPLDDSVFDMTIVFGYEGWDAQLGNNVREFTYRFTKQ